VLTPSARRVLVVVERAAVDFVDGAAASAVEAPAPDVLSVDSVLEVGVVETFSAWACARVGELLRRDVAGFFSCS
jgi:hypothetical protein